MCVYIYIYIYMCVCVHIYIYIYIYYIIILFGNHINFSPVYFSSYGNLKVIFETTFRHLSFSSFTLTSYSVYIQSLSVVKF